MGNDSQSSCPYCKKILQKCPKRKTKCIFCGNFIYVRYRPSNQIKKLVTEDQKNEIENEWNIYYNNQRKKEYETIAEEINVSRRENLMQWNNFGVLKVEVSSADNSCENCKKQNGKIYLIRDAIRNNPLPCKDCNNEKYGYCRCTYLPVIND